MGNQAALYEDENYLTEQIITYIGNKRSLLQFITKGVQIAQKRLGKNKLNIFDVFSGSGIVARYFKQFSNLLIVNDLEKYSRITNECYLSNKNDINMAFLKSLYNELLNTINIKELTGGIITELYSPKDDDNIKHGERVFYTRRNAKYIDTMRTLIENVDDNYKKYFLAPLIAEASVHSNISGVFKGFYKNKETGIGQFGGSNSDALFRIKGEIVLPFPVFSNFSCTHIIYNGDSNEIIKEAPEVDLAYLDPPYNQHPYGSNYFMLNLILENKYPETMSKVSGIPENWNRSSYNKKQFAYNALTDLVSTIKAKYVLISFNSEGFITLEEMKNMLQKIGKVEVLETTYNTFRGCRNLANRDIHVKEYLYLLEK
uniref:site-specific DNA-methyltransferase (adenine-specific) n=1 Tax=uncultured bacterium contig00063 TaxID=1181546 RepID=A0A806KCK9_9BACT|nr:DNA modification methylase (adenine-specific methyltransferase) [uncultured bacterium contig00063]